MVHARGVDELLPIGEFSERCGLSPKVLRNYAAAGLLTPAAVDRNTGYRFYGTQQLDEARTIALLRQAGVPLRDIACFLKSPTPEWLDQRERDLDVDVIARRRALESVRMHIGSIVDPIQVPTTRQRQLGRTYVTLLTAVAASDIGRMRESNQDAFLVDEDLFVVADGMGVRGEIASLLAVEVLKASVGAMRTSASLVEACREANHAVWRRAETDPELAGMGTTLTAIGVVAGTGGETLAVVNVGDSRAYLIQGGAALCITTDDSLVGDLVRAGELTESEARIHPQRSILTKALGVGPDVLPHLVQVDPAPGDRLLLCTDGLFNELEEGEIGSVLSSVKDPNEAAAELVRLANSRGGSDNVSVVVVDIARPPASLPE
jgi:protein phosphatase